MRSKGLWLVAAFIVLHAAQVLAFQANYIVRAMGLKVAKIDILENISEGKVEVTAVSLMSNKMFPRINNHYWVDFNDQYLPGTYTRTIDQDNSQDSVFVVYDHANSKASMYRRSTKTRQNYSLIYQTRDFFSLMMGLSKGKVKSGKHYVEGNGIIWQAIVEKKETEILKTKLGRFRAQRYKMEFKNTSDNKMPYIDMVTHNLLNNDTTVNIWVSENGLVIKASVTKGLISMVWELLSFHK